MKRCITIAATLLTIQANALVKDQNKKVDANNCKELKHGQSIRVNFSPTYSRTGIEMRYTLKRDANDSAEHYISYINLEFKTKHERTNNYMVSRVRNCLQSHATRLRDGAGRKLSIRLWDKNSGVQKPPKVKIGLQDYGARANSRNYPLDIRCGTVAHEALHLMGLVDEYEEKWNAWNPNLLKRIFKPIISAGSNAPQAMNCRVLGRHNSIMRSPWQSTNNKKVLFTKQMDTIIYANCKSKNADFYSCAKNAYRTSKAHGGVLGCKKMDNSCYQSDWQGH